jgi:hypothetical protein
MGLHLLRERRQHRAAIETSAQKAWFDEVMSSTERAGIEVERQFDAQSASTLFRHHLPGRLSDGVAAPRVTAAEGTCPHPPNVGRLSGSDAHHEEYSRPAWPAFGAVRPPGRAEMQGSK